MYDSTKTVAYMVAADYDFGAAGDSLSICGPSGYKGKLLDIMLAMVGEASTADTTGIKVQVGTAADVDAYGELHASGVLADTDCWNSADDTDAIIAEAIPADTKIEVTLVAPTGGTPAGKGHAYVTIEWYK